MQIGRMIGSSVVCKFHMAKMIQEGFCRGDLKQNIMFRDCVSGVLYLASFLELMMVLLFYSRKICSAPQ